ncbi:MAG TPA: hypothetical protein VKR24_12460 [Candidatus Limnocylindrales bacterium]|nr:hypothetical protein [Candidatus Limnocylindrales bacterium]
MTGLPEAAGGALQDVVVDGSKLIAVGYGSYRGPGLVWTSTDGSAWHPEPSAAVLATVPLEALAVGPSGLAAFGDDCSGTTECLANVQAFLSADGSAWTAAGPMTTRGLEGVSHAIWTGSLFVAVGRDTQPSPFDGAVWTSIDGTTWKQIPEGSTFADAVVGGVATVHAGLVAVGNVTTPDKREAVVWNSTDGRTWSRLPDQADFAGEMFDVVAGGPGYVAVGIGSDGAAVWTSADGRAWSRVADQPSLHGPAMYGVAAGPAGLAAVGYDSGGAAIWTSPDGLTWTRVPNAPDFAVAQALAVAANGNTFVAVGRGAPAGTARPYIWVSK